MPVNELLGGADSRPRIHIWPARDEPVHRYSVGPTGRRFEAMELLHDSVALAVFSMGDRLEKGAVIIIERDDAPSFGKDTVHE